MALSGAKYDGDNLKMSWNGALVETELLREIVVSTKREIYDKTGAGQKDRRKHGGKRERTMRITFWGSTRDADLLTDFDENATAVTAFIIYPNGDAVGEPKRSGNAWVDSKEETIAHDGMVSYVINCTIDGAVTYGVAP